MPTELTKPLRRRIGDYVVTLDRLGLTIRKVRKHKGIRYKWCHLFQAHPAVAWEAFASPPPRAWLPNVGDMVWCRTMGRIPHYRRRRVTRVVESLPCPLVYVREGRTPLALPLSEVRPAPARTKDESATPLFANDGSS